MVIFVVTLLAFSLAVFGMSLGVILSDRRIKGSCGGLSHLGGKHGKVACEGCPSGGKNCSDGHSAPTADAGENR